MATHRSSIRLDRPLIAAIIPSQDYPRYTERDLALARSAAYHEGYDTARSFSDSQLAEFRDEVHALQHGLLETLPTIEATLSEQLRQGLPALAMDLARRILAGFEPPVEIVEKICSETLEQLYPERENLELIVCARDAALLQKQGGDLADRYPGLKMRIDQSLRPGDCQVRSRFGLTDARLDAKLASIQHELTGAA